MVHTIAISEKTTLKYLRDRFGLERTDAADFFQEWQSQQALLTDADVTVLRRIRQRYFHQLDEGMMLETVLRGLKHIGQLSLSQGDRR
ncbi:MAG: hypothetical protein ACOYMP_09745 [Nodosilinea sp.]|jgi:hypothetical protein